MKGLYEFMDDEGLLASITHTIALDESISTPEYHFILDAFERTEVKAITRQNTLGYFRPGSMVEGEGRPPKLALSSLLNDDPAERRDTILHEVAHLVVWARWRWRRLQYSASTEPHPPGHGEEWQGWARRMGAEPRAKTSAEGFKAARNARRKRLEKTVAVCTRCGYAVKRMRRGRTDWSRYQHSDPECRGAMKNA